MSDEMSIENWNLNYSLKLDVCLQGYEYSYGSIFVQEELRECNPKI